MPSVQPYNEREVLLALSQGDEHAYEIIYKQYQPKLFLYIYPFTKKSKEQTEEILQDIFLKLWLRRETLIAIENFPKYIFRMASNQFLDSEKRSKKYFQTTFDAGKNSGDDPQRSPVYEELIFEEYKGRAIEAINALSPQRKRIFFMRFEEDYSIDEIAETLRIARTSAKKQLYEAVHFVKAYMQEHGDMPAILIAILASSVAAHHAITLPF